MFCNETRHISTDDYDTMRYDTICYFNVCSKADISRLYLHAEFGRSGLTVLHENIYSLQNASTIIETTKQNSNLTW